MLPMHFRSAKLVQNDGENHFLRDPHIRVPDILGGAVEVTFMGVTIVTMITPISWDINGYKTYANIVTKA